MTGVAAAFAPGLHGDQLIISPESQRPQAPVEVFAPGFRPSQIPVSTVADAVPMLQRARTECAAGSPYEDAGEKFRVGRRPSAVAVSEAAVPEVLAVVGGAGGQPLDERTPAAHTFGDAVIFGADAFAPGSPKGRRTLAHELVHVLRQRRGFAVGPGTPVTTATTPGPMVQRCGQHPCHPGTCLNSSDVSDVLGPVISTAGQPLPATERAMAEPFFRRSFGSVTVHTDSRAAASADALQARAYTVGSHIAFAVGEYEPGSYRGRRLLMHELAHVAQQGDVIIDSGASIALAPPLDHLEREADALADDAASPQDVRSAIPHPVQPGDGCARVQRQPSEGPSAGSAQRGAAISDSSFSPEATRTRVPRSLRSQIGSLDYYRFRNADFLARHPSGLPPRYEVSKEYYMNYGDKYVHRFVEKLRPNLSNAGQAWLDCTLRTLQTAIEDSRDRDPSAFAKLEEDSEAFRDFAYATHPDAYVRCGICSLSMPDELRVLKTPDIFDILGQRGMRQLFDALNQCGGLVLERPIERLYGVP